MAIEYKDTVTLTCDVCGNKWVMETQRAPDAAPLKLSQLPAGWSGIIPFPLVCFDHGAADVRIAIGDSIFDVKLPKGE